MVIPYLSLLVIWQGKLSMRYLFSQKISWDNFSCQMTSKDIPEIFFESYLWNIYEIAMSARDIYRVVQPKCGPERSGMLAPFATPLGHRDQRPSTYQWSTHSIPEIPTVCQWFVPGISYRAEDTCCLSMTYPRDISCCFRNRLSGMRPAIESFCQNRAQRSRRSIKHNLIYFFFFLPLGPASVPGCEGAASPSG